MRFSTSRYDILAAAIVPILLILGTSGFASDKTSHVLVTFKSQTSHQERLKIHKEMGATHQKHFASINTDLITVIGTGDACWNYRKHANVQHCEDNAPLNFPNEACPPTMVDPLLSTAAEMHEIDRTTRSQHCEILPTIGLGSAQRADKSGRDGHWQVSPLWGQQAIGADLAFSFMKEKLQKNEASRVAIANMDILSDRPTQGPLARNSIQTNLVAYKEGAPPLHGDSAGDLVDHPVFGTSPAVSWAARINLADKRGLGSAAWSSNIIEGLESLTRSTSQIVTASVGYSGHTPKLAIDRFLETGKLLIQSAGNDYPVPSSSGTPVKTGHILVGSVGPNGLRSPFSQEPVKIYAPADGLQLSGPNQNFGGTSGATPLVSGSLGNVLALLPHASQTDVETLLEATALPSFAQNATGYGPGILNSFKLAIVSDCLAKSSEKKLIPVGREALRVHPCMDQTALSKKFFEQANRKFQNKLSCVDQRDGLKALRASFLLAPSLSTALQLAKIHENLGFPGDGRWYRTLAASMGSQADQSRHFDALLAEPSLSEHRYFAGSRTDLKVRGAYALSLASLLPRDHEFSRKAVEQISKEARSSSEEEREGAISRGLSLGPRSLPVISHLIKASEDYNDPRSVVQVFGAIMAFDSKKHPWIDETTEAVRGTAFEKYLPKTTSR